MATGAEKYREWRSQGLCGDCGGDVDREGFATCAFCSARKAERNATWYFRLKAEVFEAYGGTCACCGEDESKFLQFDHIEGKGNEHRRRFGSGKGNLGVWKHLRDEGFPPGFQILCANCNFGRSLNGGVCPH